MMPKKERGASAPARGHRQSRTGKTAEAPPVRKEKTERTKAAVDPDADGTVKTTVVDIDRVREDEVKDEGVGLLEAAEQDGRREHAAQMICSFLTIPVSVSRTFLFGSLQV